MQRVNPEALNLNLLAGFESGNAAQHSASRNAQAFLFTSGNATIASMKLHELAQHRQKMNGRIVYSGDCAKYEHGAAAL